MKRNKFLTALKKWLPVLSCLFFADALAQQIPLYSQYYLNPFIYNPAFTGSEEHPKLFLVHRDQWASIPGAPTSNSASFDGHVGSNAGLGISLTNEKQNFTVKSAAYGYYSYKVHLTDSAWLRFGLSAGVFDERMDFSKALVQNQNDPYLLNAPQNNMVFDSKAGIAFVWRKFELGASALQLTGNKLQNNGYSTTDNMNRQFYLSTKYIFTLSHEKNITFYPMVMARINSGIPVQYDINGIINWQKIGWIGATYRSDYAIGLNAGLRLFKYLSVGYAYDMITNPLKSYGGLSHEIILRFTFIKHKNLEKEQATIVKQIIEFFEKTPYRDPKEEIDKMNNKIEKYQKDVEKKQEEDKKKSSKKKRDKGTF